MRIPDYRHMAVHGPRRHGAYQALIATYNSYIALRRQCIDIASAVQPDMPESPPSHSLSPAPYGGDLPSGLFR